MRLLLLCILIHLTYGHSPIFVNSNKNSIDTIVDPTHSWAYYANEFSIDTHQWKADFKQNDTMFVEFLTRRNEALCYDIEFVNNLKNDIHIYNIKISTKESYLYCSRPFFDPYSVSNYDNHGTFQEVALTDTRLVIFIEHEYEPYVLVVGKEEYIRFVDMLKFTWITAKIQGWMGHYSLGYNIIIAYCLAVAISILNDKCVNRGWKVLDRIYSVVSVFIVFSYIGNIFDKLYQFFRINDAQMLDTHDITVFSLIHLVIPFVFMIFNSTYLFFRMNIWVECFVQECFTAHMALNVIILFLFAFFSLFLFQPGAFMDIIFLVFAILLEVFEIANDERNQEEASKKFKI